LDRAILRTTFWPAADQSPPLSCVTYCTLRPGCDAVARVVAGTAKTRAGERSRLRKGDVACATRESRAGATQLVAGYDSSGGAGPREERCLARRRASAQRNSEPKGATLRLVVSTWPRMAIVGRGRRREFCRGEIDAALIGRWRARGWPPWSLTLMKGRAVWVEFNGCLGRARPAGRSTPRGPPPRGVARRGHFVRTTFWQPF